MSRARDNFLVELREVRPGLREMDGILATPKAAEVMRRTDTEPKSLVSRYRSDLPEGQETELIGYRLSPETGPASETCVHVAFDPEIQRVVIYEEW